MQETRFPIAIFSWYRGKRFIEDFLLQRLGAFLKADVKHAYGPLRWTDLVIRMPDLRLRNKVTWTSALKLDRGDATKSPSKHL